MTLRPVTDVDQVIRLEQFRREHPGVTVVFSNGFWYADWTDPKDGSERRTVQSDLKRALDVLDASFG